MRCAARPRPHASEPRAGAGPARLAWLQGRSSSGRGSSMLRLRVFIRGRDSCSSRSGSGQTQTCICRLRSSVVFTWWRRERLTTSGLVLRQAWSNVAIVLANASCQAPHRGQTLLCCHNYKTTLRKSPIVAYLQVYADEVRRAARPTSLRSAPSSSPLFSPGSRFAPGRIAVLFPVGKSRGSPVRPRKQFWSFVNWVAH